MRACRPPPLPRHLFLLGLVLLAGTTWQDYPLVLGCSHDDDYGDCDDEIVLEPVGNVPTRGASGFAYFSSQDRHYLLASHFFTSAPPAGRRANMTTDSVLFEIHADWKLEEKQRFETTGAHGVETTSIVVTAYDDEQQQQQPTLQRRFATIPNFYGSTTLILQWNGNSFDEVQQVESNGPSAVHFFRIADRLMLAIAQFYDGTVDLFEYTQNRKTPFRLWQQLDCRGVAAVTTIDTGHHLLLVAASYNDAGKWQTKSRIFRIDKGNNNQQLFFQWHQDIDTEGAHGVETFRVGDRIFCFISNDRNEKTPQISSKLLEWVYDTDRFESIQTIPTDGAHAATYFQLENSHFLAVANLGDRSKGSYRRQSAIYSVDAQDKHNALILKLVDLFSTFGAADFEAFEMNENQFLIVANEQDDELGADIMSTVWQLKRKLSMERSEL